MKKNNKIILKDTTGNEFEFKIMKGSSGPSVVDLSDFYAKTGMFVYDPGFSSTASCQSEITFIDGN